MATKVKGAKEALLGATEVGQPRGLGVVVRTMGSELKNRSTLALGCTLLSLFILLRACTSDVLAAAKIGQVMIKILSCSKDIRERRHPDHRRNSNRGRAAA